VIEALAPIAAVDPASSATNFLGAANLTTTKTSFEQILQQGIAATDSKIAQANQLVTDFAVDGSIPAHQVTFALEEARLSLELMIQVRNRLIEGYQQIMNMQI
jgi:flagellar hook-basal body complex protein FliE